MRVGLDFESDPILAEHVSQRVADLAYGTFRADRSQYIVKQVLVLPRGTSQLGQRVLRLCLATLALESSELLDL